MKKLLLRYSPAAAELHRERAQNSWALLLVPVYGAATIVGVQQADRQPNVAGSRFSKASVPLSIPLGAFSGSIYLGASNTYFAKAIEAYKGFFFQKGGFTR